MNHVHTDTVTTLYRATTTQWLVRVPQLWFRYLDGHGDPNTSLESASGVPPLHAVSYGAKLAITRSGGPSYRESPPEDLIFDGRRHKHHEIYHGEPRPRRRSRERSSGSPTRGEPADRSG